MWALVGGDSQGEEDEEQQSEEQEHRLSHCSSLYEEHTDRRYNFFAHESDYLPVVGSTSESIEEESVLSLHSLVFEKREVLVESEESEERESHHPNQHSWNSYRQHKVVVTTGRDPAFLR